MRPGGCRGQISMEMALLLIAVVATVGVFAVGLSEFGRRVGSGWSQAMEEIAGKIVERAKAG
ncbi:hypothetical protein [Methanopyrus sp.]